MTGYEAVQAEIKVLLQHYATTLGLPGHAAAYAEAIAPAAWDAFPKGSKLHYHEVFAEVVTFHAIKAAGLPLDQAAFREASLVGKMPVNQRHWLLIYQQHLPPALRVASREPSPEAWLSRMPAGPVVDEARAILARNEGAVARLRPRMQASACLLAAWKRLGSPRFDGTTMAVVLDRAGLSYSSSYNAAIRVGLIMERARIKATVALPRWSVWMPAISMS
jgi:hypothetical protein